MKKNIIIILLLIISISAVGYIVYDKVLKEEEKVKVEEKNTNNSTPELNIEEPTCEDMIGNYSWKEKKTIWNGAEVTYQLNIELKSDNTATYQESDGMADRSTKGTYSCENNKIIYTEKYWNYEEGENEPIEYDEEEQDKDQGKFTFNTVDKDTITGHFQDEEVVLKKN
jgi:hypothetical protein